MTVSVVLAVYNGEKTLRRQLDSIRRQSTAPDEVLICDDCSTDTTRTLVREYIEQYRLTNWQLQENEQNLGWKQNFMQGMKKSRGELIFPCDQDDRWYPEKIAEMVRTMEQDPAVLLLSCDMQILYEGKAIKAKVYRETAAERKKPYARYGFTEHFFMNPRPGCSYAIRRTFFDDVCEGWKENYPHDEFLWLTAALQDGAYFQNEVLMDFIRSEENASDIRYKDIAKQKENLEYIQSTLEYMEAYAEANPDRVPADHLDKVKTARIWCRKRMRLMETRNPAQWLALMPYRGYYNSVKNCLSDLYLVLFGSFRRKAR